MVMKFGYTGVTRGALGLKRSTLWNSTLNPKNMSTFVNLHNKKDPLLRNSTLNPKKGTLLSDFMLKKVHFWGILQKPKKVHLKKFTFENSTLNQKRYIFVEFQAKKGPLLRNSTLSQKNVHFCWTSRYKRSTLVEFYAKPKKVPRLSDFMIKKVHFWEILRYTKKDPLLLISR